MFDARLPKYATATAPRDPASANVTCDAEAGKRDSSHHSAPHAARNRLMPQRHDPAG
jgi:hypothetical protein